MTIAPRFPSRRGPLRVYRALCVVCAAPGGSTPERLEVLAEHRARLGLTRSEAVAVERASRSPLSLRLGNATAERVYLRAALLQLARAGAPPAGAALSLLGRLLAELAPAATDAAPRRGPFEPSDEGCLPLVRARTG